MKKLIFAAALMIASAAAHAQQHTQCTATTKAGTQCKHHATSGSSYCNQHNPDRVKCAGTTKAGKPCQLSPKKGTQFCHLHTSK